MGHETGADFLIAQPSAFAAFLLLRSVLLSSVIAPVMRTSEHAHYITFLIGILFPFVPHARGISTCYYFAL